MSPLLISLAAFVGVTALVAGVAFMLRGNKDSDVEDRLAMLTGGTASSKAKGAMKQSVLARPLESTQNVLMEYLARLGNVQLLLEQADSALSSTNFVLVCGGMALVGAFIPAAAGYHPSLWPAVALCAGLLPFVWVIFKRKRRFKKFAKQLPDALELIGRALRAGHSLASGFHLVSNEMQDPIGKEFNRVFEEQNLGVPLEDALDTMTDRIPNLDLRFFATAVILQRQTGGDLAEILDKIGYLVRERFKIWGQVQALTGEGRLSGIVLLALPPALFAAVYRLNPDYVMPLFTDPMGRQMLVGGLVMQLLGALVIRKIVNIKV
jgi:tight adherence protein B